MTKRRLLVSWKSMREYLVGSSIETAFPPHIDYLWRRSRYWKRKYEKRSPHLNDLYFKKGNHLIDKDSKRYSWYFLGPDKQYSKGWWPVRTGK